MANKDMIILINGITHGEILNLQHAISMRQPASKSLNIHIVYVLPELLLHHVFDKTNQHCAMQLYSIIKSILKTVGKKLHVTVKHQWLLAGSIRTEVLKLAKLLQTDYILTNSPAFSQRSLFFRQMDQIHEFNSLFNF